MKKEVTFCQFPHFFKAYMPHSSSQRMKLPRGLSERIPGGPIPRKLFLRNCGKRFSVGLGSIGSDLFFEGDGWVKFINENKLVENHMMVFTYISTNTFDFKILELNGCEKIDEDVEEVEATKEVKEEEVEAMKEIEAEEAKQKDDDAEEEEEEEEGRKRKRRKGKGREANFDIYGADIFRSGQYIQPPNPYFVTKVRQGRKDMVYIPNDVVKLLKYDLQDYLKVHDPRGVSYTLKLKPWVDGRKWYTGGWRRLCESNLVVEGDRIICEFIQMDEQQSIEMQINIVRVGHPSN